MCEMCFDLEWTIIMHLYQNGGSGKQYTSSLHLSSEWRTWFPVWFIVMPAR